VCTEQKEKGAGEGRRSHRHKPFTPLIWICPPDARLPDITINYIYSSTLLKYKLMSFTSTYATLYFYFTAVLRNVVLFFFYSVYLIIIGDIVTLKVQTMNTK